MSYPVSATAVSKCEGQLSKIRQKKIKKVLLREGRKARGSTRTGPPQRGLLAAPASVMKVHGD